MFDGSDMISASNMNMFRNFVLLQSAKPVEETGLKRYATYGSSAKRKNTNKMNENYESELYDFKIVEIVDRKSIAIHKSF